MELLRLLGVFAVNWFIKDMSTPPAGTDGKNQVGAEPGDQVAPGGNPKYYRHLYFLIMTFTTLWYGSQYWNSRPLEFWEFMGFLLATGGYALRQWSTEELGKFHTFVVGVKHDHVLIQSGPYQYLIHPSYTGQFVCYVGFLMYLHAPYWLSIAVLGLAIYVISQRSHAEEEILRKHFLKDYDAYFQSRKRFIPYVY